MARWGEIVAFGLGGVVALAGGIPPPVAAAETTRTSVGTWSSSGPEAVPVGDRPIGHQPARIYRTPFEIEDVIFLEDGHAVVVEVDRTVGTSRVTSVAHDGAVVEGWPWTPFFGDGAGIRVDLKVARGDGDLVYALVRRSAVQRSSEIESSGVEAGSRAGSVFAHELRLLDRSGRELPGFPVPLTSTSFCGLDAHADVAYVACQPGWARGSMPTVIFAVRPDGSLPQGWPARMHGSATIVGFRSDGGIVVEVVRRWQPIGPKRPHGRLIGEEALVGVLGPDGSVMPGWPRRLQLVDQYAEAAVIDAQDRLRIARREWSEGACGPAIRTVYSTLDVDGDPYPGWPVTVPDWASDPAVGPDGTVVVARSDGTVTAYAPSGRVASGWPTRGVALASACMGGSQPWSAGDDGVVLVGEDRVTLISWDGRVAVGWPVILPHEAARACPGWLGCTPGPSVPLPPAIGGSGIWVATYDDRVPWVIGIDRGGRLHDAWRQAVGDRGDQVLWVRVGPTGVVWVASRSSGDGGSSSLQVVHEDGPPPV